MNTANTDDFSVAKVGDRVWVRVEIYNGWGEVIDTDSLLDYPVEVRYLDKTTCFTAQGHILKLGPQCLFWSKPEIIAPLRPNVKVLLLRNLNKAVKEAKGE